MSLLYSVSLLLHGLYLKYFLYYCNFHIEDFKRSVFTFIYFAYFATYFSFTFISRSVYIGFWYFFEWEYLLHTSVEVTSTVLHSDATSSEWSSAVLSPHILTFLTLLLLWVGIFHASDLVTSTVLHSDATSSEWSGALAFLWRYKFRVE